MCIHVHICALHLQNSFGLSPVIPGVLLRVDCSICLLWWCFFFVVVGWLVGVFLLKWLHQLLPAQIKTKNCADRLQKTVTRPEMSALCLEFEFRLQ